MPLTSISAVRAHFGRAARERHRRPGRSGSQPAQPGLVQDRALRCTVHRYTVHPVSVQLTGTSQQKQQYVAIWGGNRGFEREQTQETVEHAQWKTGLTG